MNCSPVRSLLAVLTASTTSVSTVLTSILLYPRLVLSAACCSIRVSASSRVQGNSSNHHQHNRKSLCCYVITEKIELLCFVPFSRRNWCQFPDSFLLPSTLIRIPVPVFILMAALRLASRYSSNTTSTR